MKYYFAPMEGITGYIYRNAYEKYFGNIDKYFTPFIVPNESKKTNTREFRGILKANNEMLNVVPQILTNDAKGFINTAEKIESLGYSEVNFNLGCPANTVIKKGKGSGFLKDTEELDNFLNSVFSELNIKISLKVRLGLNKEEEFYKLLEIYNKYPLEELIIHPRTREQFYGGNPNLEIFKYALKESKNKIIYNGDVFNRENFKEITRDIKDIDTLMLGRGLLVNPGLIGEIERQEVMNKNTLENFVVEMFENYREVFKEDRLALFRMKELWSYLSYIMSNSKDYIKEIKRAESTNEYNIAVTKIFKEQEILKNGGNFKR